MALNTQVRNFFSLRILKEKKKFSNLKALFSTGGYFPGKVSAGNSSFRRREYGTLLSLNPKKNRRVLFWMDNVISVSSQEMPGYQIGQNILKMRRDKGNTNP